VPWICWSKPPPWGAMVACVEQWLGDKPLTWSPTPDGIWLMNAEGSGITHLNRQRDGEYQARNAIWRYRDIATNTLVITL